MTYVHVQEDSKKKQMPLNEGSSAIARGLMLCVCGSAGVGVGAEFCINHAELALNLIAFNISVFNISLFDNGDTIHVKCVCLFECYLTSQSTTYGRVETVS